MTPAKDIRCERCGSITMVKWVARPRRHLWCGACGWKGDAIDHGGQPTEPDAQPAPVQDPRIDRL